MAVNKDVIHFVITGGTLDSFYNGIMDTVTPRKDSIVPSFIKSMKLYEKIKFEEICMKDSRSLTKTDLKNTLKAVQKSPHKKIIITHGTYTMPDTARFLEENLERSDQVIVLTGSMIPLQGFSPSDGGFNLGYSVAQVQILPPGIYVCMNGRVFSPKEVIKVLYKGKFDSIFSKNK